MKRFSNFHCRDLRLWRLSIRPCGIRWFSFSRSAWKRQPGTATNCDVSGPVARLSELVASGALRDDAAQRGVVERLQRLHDELEGMQPPRHSQPGTQTERWLPKWARTFMQREEVPPPPPEGVYIHGDVGTGKTMVMDMFYEGAPVAKKRRVHFHAFMLDVNHRIHRYRTQRGGRSDPIPPLASELVSEAWLLCFDEFQVTDVADAMLLHRLFGQLWALGTVVVATSNRHPKDLYQGGLQRQLFLPFIDLLLERCDVLCLDAGKDYRLAGAQAATQVYYWPDDHAQRSRVQALWAALTHGEKAAPARLDAGGRPLHVPAQARGVARFSFSDLCARALGAEDYIAVARAYHTVVVEGVPVFKPHLRDELKRFIVLVDELYNHKVKLVVLAAAAPDALFTAGEPRTLTQGEEEMVALLGHAALAELYQGKEERFAAARCLSRLREMQSAPYLTAPHQPAAHA